MEKEMKFKTNINCGGCISRVTPFMDRIEGIKSWDVDVNSADKILTVESEGVTPEQVMEAVRKVGFDIKLE